MISTMFSHPLLLWAAWLSVIACGVTAMSCFLLINNWPRAGMWPQKSATFFVLFGATATAAGPFFGYDMEPDALDLMFRCGIAVFAISHTNSLWREFRMLDRRKPSNRERRKELCSH